MSLIPSHKHEKLSEMVFKCKNPPGPIIVASQRKAINLRFQKHFYLMQIYYWAQTQSHRIWMHTTVVPWPFQHMSVEWIINFENSISTNGIFPNIHYFPSQYIYIYDLEETNFENFNIFENNIINVELAKVLRYFSFQPLFNSHHLAPNHCSWPMRNKSFSAEEQMIFLAQILCKALTVRIMCNFTSPKEDSLCSSVHFHSKKSTERPIYLLQFIW